MYWPQGRAGTSNGGPDHNPLSMEVLAKLYKNYTAILHLEKFMEKIYI
jgi:hypothetical protein